MEPIDHAAASSRRPDVAHDLAALCESFGLGEVWSCRFLPSGLMNDNWRVETVAGVFALKRLRDVAPSVARRNLAVLSELADGATPARPPWLTSGGETVAEVDGRSYCLIPWIEGDHLPGTALSEGQAADLGVALGVIHRQLNSKRLAPLLPPASLPMAPPVTTGAAARAEADRLLARIASLEHPRAFDTDAVRVLHERKRLLDTCDGERPGSAIAAGPIGWTHGDLQQCNVLWRDATVVGVIDWDRIRIRPLGEEVARTATVQFASDDGALDLARTAKFVAGYRSVVPISVPALADAVERLWWKRVSDYWHLVFHYDRNDPSCDHLFLPAERLLHWWTTRRTQVQAAFATMP
ncbi:MAG: phosphotransferase [Pseudonocardiaceae bacterium]